MRNSRGFTLIELMITIVIVAVLATIAIPSFRTLIDSNAVTTEANNILSSILFARSEAIKQELAVVFTQATGEVKQGTNVLLVQTPTSNGATTAVNGTAAIITFNSRGRATTTMSSTDFFAVTKGAASSNVCFNTNGRPSVKESACP